MSRQLDMCDHLLTKYEPLRKDSLMATALAETEYMCGRAVYQEKAVELLAGRFSLDVDVVGPDA